MNKTFKITVEYICPNMIDEESLHLEYNGDAYKAYRDISDDFADHPINFTDEHKVVKVELFNQPK